MNYLTNITGSNTNQINQSNTNDLINKEEYSLIVMIVDWSVLNLKNDPDVNSTCMKKELVRMGIEGFGLLEEEKY